MSGIPPTSTNFPKSLFEESKRHFYPSVTRIFGLSSHGEEGNPTSIRVSHDITGYQWNTEFEVRDSNRTRSYSLRAITPREAGVQQITAGRWKSIAKDGFFVTKEDPFTLLSLSDWNADKYDPELCHFFECTDIREASNRVISRLLQTTVCGAVLSTMVAGETPRLLAENPQSYVARPGTTTLRDIMRQVLHREDDAYLQAFARANNVQPDTTLNIGTMVHFPQANVQTSQTQAQRQAPSHQSPQKIVQDAPAENTTTYTVRPGDTLSKIAQHHHVSLKTLCAENRIKGSLIHPGQILRIPGQTAQPNTNTRAQITQTVTQKLPEKPNISTSKSIEPSSSFDPSRLVTEKNIDTGLLRQVLQAMFNYKPARASDGYYGFITAIGKSLGFVPFGPDQAPSTPLGNSQNEQMYAILWVLQDYLHDHGIILELPMDKSSVILPTVTREQFSHVQRTDALKFYGEKIGFKKPIDPDRLTNYLNTQNHGENIFIMTWKIGENKISSLMFRTQHGYQVVDTGMPGKKITPLTNYINYLNPQGAHLQTIVGSKLRWSEGHVPIEEADFPTHITHADSSFSLLTPEAKITEGMRRESIAQEEPGMLNSFVQAISNLWNGKENKTTEQPKIEIMPDITPTRTAEIQVSIKKDLPPIDIISGRKYGFKEETAEEFAARIGADFTNFRGGMQNNNPYNIKFSGSDWQMQICVGWVNKESINTDQKDTQSIFKGPEHGVYSAVRMLLHRFQNNGLNTVRKLIASNGLGWTQNPADPSNPIGNSAAEKIARRMHVDPDAIIDFRDKKVFISFLNELLVQEVPGARYYRNMVTQAVELLDRDASSPAWPGYFSGYPEPANRPVMQATKKPEPKKVLKTIAINTTLPGISRDINGFSTDDIANIVGTAILEPLGSMRGPQKGGLAPDTERLSHIAEKIGIGQDVKDVVFGNWCGANVRAMYESIVQHLNSRGVQIPHIWAADIGTGSGVGNYFDHTREKGGLPSTARVINGIKSKPGKAELESLLLNSAGHIFIISYSHRGNGHVNMAFRVKTSNGDKLVIFDPSWLTGATLTSEIKGIGGFHDAQKYIASFVNGEKVLDEQGKLGNGAAPNRYNVTSVLAISHQALPAPLPPPLPIPAQTVASTITGMPLRVTSLLTGKPVSQTVTHKINGEVVLKPYTIEARKKFLTEYLRQHPDAPRLPISLSRYDGQKGSDNIFLLGWLQQNPDIYQAWQEEVMKPENMKSQHVTSN